MFNFLKMYERYILLKKGLIISEPERYILLKKGLIISDPEGIIISGSESFYVRSNISISILVRIYKKEKDCQVSLIVFPTFKNQTPFKIYKNIEKYPESFHELRTRKIIFDELKSPLFLYSLNKTVEDYKYLIRNDEVKQQIMDFVNSIPALIEKKNLEKLPFSSNLKSTRKRL